jgi:hypothetical protein
MVLRGVLGLDRSAFEPFIITGSSVRHTLPASEHAMRLVSPTTGQPHDRSAQRLVSPYDWSAQSVGTTYAD